MAKFLRVPLGPHLIDIVHLIRSNAQRHSTFDVFRDFCELAAISLSNAVDGVHWDAREQRYLQIVGRYQPDEVARFPQMLGHLALSLQTTFHDALGSLFMAMELGNAWKGQSFTPYSVSRAMAAMALSDAGSVIERQGFITVADPAVGGGAMMIAAADVLHEAGFNYADVLHVTAHDIDATAVTMSYVQFSLLGIPAVVRHGDSLKMEVRDYWVTPAHVLGRWSAKLAAKQPGESPALVPALPTHGQPLTLF